MKKTNSVDSQATTPPSSTTTIIDENENKDDNVNDNDNDNHVIVDLDPTSITSLTSPTDSVDLTDSTSPTGLTDSTSPTSPTDSTSPTGPVDSEQIALMIDKSKAQVLEEIKKQFKIQLLDEFKDLLTLKMVDKPLLIKILIRGMEIIESTSIKGKDQKDLVIDVLIQILETDGVDVSHKEQLIQFLKEDANAFIDVIVDASKGKININKVESVITIAIKYLFACFKKK